MFKKSLVTACVLIASFASVAQSSILLDRVVAIVNKEVITWSDLYREMEFDASDQVKAMKDEDRRRFFKENEKSFLENLIDLKLQLQEAAKEGITTTDADVAAAVKNIKNKYSMTDEIFNETIVKDGFTLETYKKKLGEQITVNRVVDQEVRSKILVTERDIDTYLAGNKDAAKDLEGFDVSHILLKRTGDDKLLEQRAWDIYKKLQAGEGFPELARRYSDDPSARGGGDLGFVRRCDMSKEFLNVCLSIKPGDISEPLWREDGIYIIRVNEARVFKSEQEMREAIRQKLLSEKFGAALKNWARELRDRAYVEIKA
jgi:peptidyl-prolyl cis-trans isomerase SurA